MGTELETAIVLGTFTAVSAYEIVTLSSISLLASLGNLNRYSLDMHYSEAI